MIMELTWEVIEKTHHSSLCRTKVRGGWLVRQREGSADHQPIVGITFVPDPNHEWKI